MLLVVEGAIILLYMVAIFPCKHAKMDHTISFGSLCFDHLNVPLRDTLLGDACLP